MKYSIVYIAFNITNKNPEYLNYVVITGARAESAIELESLGELSLGNKCKNTS